MKIQEKLKDGFLFCFENNEKKLIKFPNNEIKKIKYIASGDAKHTFLISSY